MNSSIVQRFIAYFFFLVLFQLPLLHNWVLFDRAFAFPYVGFLLLMPISMGRGWLMTLGFSIGFLMDIISDTPGMHASASVFICYVRSWWFGFSLDLGDSDLDLTLTHLGWVKFAVVFMPLIFVHHIVLFVFENEGLGQFWALFGRIFWSSLYSYLVILLVAFGTAPKRKR